MSDRPTSAARTGAGTPASRRSAVAPDVTVPDHELLHPIGRGAYGEVWLAVNVMGTGRAVKIVRRESFESDRPFEREFAAVKRYEPLSRTADGLVNVLHAGRAEDGGVFYYVMELADAENGGEFDATDAAEYRPRTLRATLDQLGGRLPLAECLSCAQSLTQAVAALHSAGLTHRDIKPSNIIFVNNRPKLADIGLVGAAGETRSFVGTEGYIPPEGPGETRADLYALGMVFYVMAAGRTPSEFPAVPPEWLEAEDATAMEFMEIIVRATEAAAERRYGSALEMLADITLLQSGGSVRRMRLLEHRWRWAKRIGLSAAAGIALAGAGLWVWQREQVRAARVTAAEMRSEAAQTSEREQRFLALRERAAATLRLPMNGARAAALKAIDEAAALHPGDAALRDLLVTTLTRADFSPRKSWTHHEVSMAPAVSPDGKLIALVEKDGGIRVESTADNAVVCRLPAWPGTRPWARWRFTADGKYLGVDYGKPPPPPAPQSRWLSFLGRFGPTPPPNPTRFRWWRLRDGAVVWEGAPAVVSLGGVPPRGNVITAYDPTAGKLIRYDLDAGREVQRRSLSRVGTDFILSPDGRKAFFFYSNTTASVDGCFVDLERMRIIHRAGAFFPNRSAAWLPDSRHLLLGDPAAPFAVTSLGAEEGLIPKPMLHLHTSTVVDVAVSRDGQFMLTGSWDQTTRLTDLATGTSLALVAGWGGNGSAGFSTDGKQCWRSVMQGNSQPPTLVWCDFHRPVVRAYSSTRDERKTDRPFFSPDSAWLLTGGQGLTIYRVADGEAVRLLEDEGVQSCAFVEDEHGPAVLCGSDFGLYRLRLPEGDQPWRVEGQLAQGDFDDIVASRDGRFAIAWGMDVPSLAVRSGVVSAWPGPRGVVCAALTDDGTVGACTTGGRQVLLQNAEGKTTGHLPTSEKTWLSLSPDGGRIFLNESEALRCVNTADGREVWRIPKDFPSIRGTPRFMEEGRLVVARTGLHFSILDAATGEVRCRLDPYTPFHGVSAVASPDGKHLAMTSSDCLLIWDLETLRGELRKRGLEW